MTTQGFELDTPIGRVRGVLHDDALVLLDLPNGGRIGTLPPGGPGARRVCDRIARYFDGDLAALAGIRCAPAGGTAFQRRVWQALRDIPVGSTASYGDIARRIGSPSAVRAVGAANGANHIPLVLPCHRVIGSNGALRGFGGGLTAKAWLLRHEGASVCNGMVRVS